MADLAAIGRAVVDAQSYMTLGTADAGGTPWVSPVWYAPDGYTEFLWMSDTEARHSRNIAVRPEISIVIFDSGAPINRGQGVYMSGFGEMVKNAEHAIEVYARRSVNRGGTEWMLQDVRPPSRLRLYRAVALEQFMLGDGNERVPVPLKLD